MAADDSSEKLISPTSMGHFGVRTPPEHYQAMVKWHLDFFGGKAVWQNDVATMITFDDEHHREVIVSDPAYKLIEHRQHAAGIYHIAFHLPTLADLATSYEQKKARGILPHWPVNHGMTTSMYYFDPTGNEFELQVNNFDTSEEARQFMEGPEFQENSIGVDLVVDDWIKRVRSGEDERSLKKRPIIGRRQTRWENSIYFKLEEK